MKLPPFIIAVQLLFCVNCAFASVIAYDDFESYSVGELDTANGGVGWSGSWNADTSISEVVDVSSNPLSYTFSSGQSINGGDRALSITGNDNFAVDRGFSNSEDDTILMAFLMRVDTGSSLQDNDFATVWLGTGTFVGAPAVGLKANQGDGSGVDDLMGRIDGNQEVYEGEAVIGDTYYLVARISKSDGLTASNYDTLEFWVNPEAGDEFTPDGVSTISGGIPFSTFSDMGIRSVNLDAGDNVLFDNFTYADSWTDIVPVPEPSSLIMLALSASSFLLKRRR